MKALALFVTLSLVACKTREFNSASTQSANETMRGSKYAVKIYQGAAAGDHTWNGTIEAENTKGTCKIVESESNSLGVNGAKDRFISCKYTAEGKSKVFNAIAPHAQGPVRGAIVDSKSVSTSYCSYDTKAPDGLLMTCNGDGWEPARISLKINAAGRNYTIRLSAAPNFSAALTCTSVPFESKTSLETLQCTGKDKNGSNFVYNMRLRADFVGVSGLSTYTVGYVAYKGIDALSYHTFICSKSENSNDPSEHMTCNM